VLLLLALGAKAVASKEQEVQLAAVWVQAAGALLVLGVAWRFHLRILPYDWKHQNAVESFLFLSNVVIIMLAMLYTGLGQSHDFVYSDARSTVESLMVAVLIGGLLAAALWLVHSYRKGAKRQAELAQDRALNLGGGATVARRGTIALASADAERARAEIMFNPGDLTRVEEDEGLAHLDRDSSSKVQREISCGVAAHRTGRQEGPHELASTPQGTAIRSPADAQAPSLRKGAGSLRARFLRQTAPFRTPARARIAGAAGSSPHDRHGMPTDPSPGPEMQAQQADGSAIVLALSEPEAREANLLSSHV
jgi:hypothetical protein